MTGLKRLLATAMLTAAPFAASAQETPAGPVIMPGPAPDYARFDHWLCRPGNMTACTPPLDATIIAPHGRLTVERFKADAHPKVDCFYVYPTASLDPASNSDLVPGNGNLEEIPTVRAQFARMASVCRLFAPMYRSRTTTALGRKMPPGDPKMAYDDVAKAWAYYLTHDNHGRGVVLVGHSQGSGILRELIRKEIDGKPAQKLLVSALLAGNDVGVPPGRDVGGDFTSIPLCRSTTQTGCLVAWNSYRASAPPPANAVLGAPRKDGLVNACVNPAAPGGGDVALHPYLRTRWSNPPIRSLGPRRQSRLPPIMCACRI
ncbi:DUF3089 domain-containing protein [Sphingobium nicotianae]|uniref:DUF3089 domain-containing protein n=1 Tax=Sphingobium nicotianae TaxID=2782607 RepID=A0A9X1DC08_9SPHN|nr:DUF3089 domain-containing protein [Sphingobium nicotianae]MBT2187148.1 DUF3089 domain-containing protein [Sphingobium nicotianae]